MLRDIKETIITLLFYLMRIFPIQNNKIVIASFVGKGYGDNGRYIVEAIRNRYPDADLDIVWLCKIHSAMPKYVRQVNFSSLRAIYERCTARVWVDNARQPGYVRKRKGQYYINTWHGNTALKKVEKDAAGVLSDYYIRAAIRDSKMVDLFLSGGTWESRCYRDSFWYDGQILEIGYPRQDMLFRNDMEKKAKIKKRLGIEPDKKVLLYAPTFRSGNMANNLNVFGLDYDRVASALGERFGNQWQCLVRLHPNIARMGDQLHIPDNVLNVTMYDDMQELILISDCVISDYSSSIIEAGVVKKPGFLFTVDYDDYMHNRDAYVKLEDMPFPLAKSNDALIEKIRQFSEEEYMRRWEAFYKGFYGLIDGGDAANQVAEIIMSKIGTH